MKLPPKSVTVNPDGSAIAKVYINGRRHQKKLSTRKLAEDWLAKQKLELERDEIYGRGDRILFSTLVSQYRKEKTKAKSSTDRDKYILDRVLPWFKKNDVEYVADITKGLMSEYEGHRRTAGVIQRTINIDIKQTAAILNHALKRDRIKYNPLAAYPYQSDAAPFARVLSSKEIDALLGACRGFENMMIYTALTLGMRNEEVIYLEFSDVKNNIVHLGKKMVWDINKGKREWNPKWGRERWTPLNKEYVNDELLIKFFSGKKSGYCFPNPRYKDGRPMDRSRFLKIVKRAALKAKIKDWREINAHTLRHTHISFMVARVGLDKSITIRHIMDYVGINDYKTLMGYTKAVKGLSSNLPDPTRFPWQKQVTKK
jgi:integrase